MSDNNQLLLHQLEPLQPFLKSNITELVINRPCEVLTESGGQWTAHDMPTISPDWITVFARVVATESNQDIGMKQPLLSTRLSNGMRIQIILPPAVPNGQCAIAIRVPSSSTITWEQVRAQRMLEHIKSREKSAFSDVEQQLLELKRAEKYEDFLKLAVKSRQNIVISGRTGTGKTTFTNLLITEIPLEERLGTIEDAQEIVLPHPNCIRLIYSEGKQGVADVTADDLFKACMRLRLDRILLSEIRGAEAFAYINCLYSGHPGSITSMHTGSTAEAFDRMVMYFKQHPVGQTFETDDVRALFYSQIDVVMQFDMEDGRRYVKELYYDPLMKQAMLNRAGQTREQHKSLLKTQGFDLGE